MKLKRGLLNIATGLLSQVVVILLGLIIPYLTIGNYGSEVNGYMTMVAQIYAYIALLEAGLGTAALQALYRPVAEHNREAISAIINASTQYYRKLSIVYALAVCVAGLLLPVFLNSTLDSIEITAYFLLFGASNVINFMFTASMRPLLLAEGKTYVTDNITTIFHVVSQFAKIFLLGLNLNIVVLQFVYSAINILQIGVYYIYFYKFYGWIDKTILPAKDALRQKNIFLIQQIRDLIFSCTDVVLLSIVCDLTIASIYAVYMLIFNALNTAIISLTTGTLFILGQIYSKSRERYFRAHRLYEITLLIATFTVFTVAYLLCEPFIRLYTQDIADINYVDAYLPLLFALSGLLTICRLTSLRLINFAYHAKKALKQTIVEAVINIVLSLILVQTMGIHGVLIATCIALFVRLLVVTSYVYKNILHQSSVYSFKVYFINFMIFFMFVLVRQNIVPDIAGYVDFCINGIVFTLLTAMIYLVCNIVCNWDISKFVFIKIKERCLK